MDLLAEMRSVTKTFGRVRALDGFDLVLEAGHVVGLLGANGAGKSTAMRILTGLLRADSGTARILEEEAWTLSPTTRRRIGYLSEAEFPFPTFALGRALRLVAGLAGTLDAPYVEDLQRRLQVPGDAPYSKLSLGQRRKFHLLTVLASKPEVLLLDDPALGLDVIARREFMQVVLPLIADNRRAILCSSHIFSDVERMADRIVIVRAGRVVLADDLDKIKETVRHVTVRHAAALPSGHVLAREDGPTEDRIFVRDLDGDLLRTLQEQGALVDNYDPSLEDLFIALARESQE